MEGLERTFLPFRFLAVSFPSWLYHFSSYSLSVPFYFFPFSFRGLFLAISFPCPFHVLSISYFLLNPPRLMTVK